PSSITPSFLPSPSPTSPYPLSLHDALPIFTIALGRAMFLRAKRSCGYVKQHNETRGLDYRADVRRYLFVMFTSSFMLRRIKRLRDRKSTRLNSSHLGISYAVFCLKKKKTKI